jgi:hypothetical protein
MEKLREFGGNEWLLNGMNGCWKKSGAFSSNAKRTHLHGSFFMSGRRVKQCEEALVVVIAVDRYAVKLYGYVDNACIRTIINKNVTSLCRSDGQARLYR